MEPLPLEQPSLGGGGDEGAAVPDEGAAVPELCEISDSEPRPPFPPSPPLAAAGVPPGLDDLLHLEDFSFGDEPPEGSGAFADDHDFSLVDSGELEWYGPVQDHSVPVDDGPEPSDRLLPDFVQDPGSLPFQEAAVLRETKRLRLCGPKQPWEQGIFVSSHLQIPEADDSWFVKHGTSSVGLNDSLSPPQRDVISTVEEPSLPWVVEHRLRHFRIQKSDDDIRLQATKRLRTILMLDPLATELGRAIISDINALCSEEEIAASFNNAFAAKSAGTLEKRAGHLSRMARWLMSRGEPPLGLTESLLYEFLRELESSAGATTGEQILSALRFLDGTARFSKIALDEILSARVRGLAQKMFLSKEPLKQRPPLKAWQVRALEKFVAGASERHAVIGGQLLFCFHSGCRWKDSLRIMSTEISEDEETGTYLIISKALTSKTTRTVQMKTQLLPYVCLGMGVFQFSWARRWLDARAKQSLGEDGLFLPTFSERLGKWGQTPMSASEASIYLREFLIKQGSSEQAVAQLGTHSLKRTLLMWAGKSVMVKFSGRDRRLLGHHLDKENKSMVIYSVEAFLDLYGRVKALFETIASETFDPDAPPAVRVAQAAETFRSEPAADDRGPPGRGGGAEGDPGDSDGSRDSGSSEGDDEECDAAGDQGVVLPRTEGRPPFEGVDWAACLTHRRSGITHVRRDESSLLCGRTVTASYIPAREALREGWDPECCLQCSHLLRD